MVEVKEDFQSRSIGMVSSVILQNVYDGIK